MSSETKKKNSQPLKERIFSALNFPDSKEITSILVAFGMFSAILVSALITILETDQTLIQNYAVIIIIVEVILASAFTLEYVLRLWTADISPVSKDAKNKQLSYIKSGIGIIDLLSCLFFVLPLFIPLLSAGLGMVRVLHFVVFLKFFRYSETFEILWAVIERKKVELVITFFLSLILLFFAAVAITIAEHDVQPDKFTNLFSSMYFSGVSLFTIGYGEIVPITPLGKIIAGVVSFLGITFFLLPASVIASGFIDEFEERNPTIHKCPNCEKEIEEDEFLTEKVGTSKGPTEDKKDFQNRLYKLIEYNFPNSIGQTIIFLMFLTVIGLNTLSFMVESNLILAQQLRSILDSIYLFSAIFFTIFYLLRIWAVTTSKIKKYQHPIRGRLRFICSWIGVIDLVIIISLFLTIVPNAPAEFQFFKFLKVLIVFELAHITGLFDLMYDIFRENIKEFFITVGICCIFLLFASSLIYYIENPAQPAKFSSVLDTFWWGIITFTTTGYGDMYPITTFGRFSTISMAFLGVSLFTIPAGILGASFFSSMKKYSVHRICPFCRYIISKPKIKK